MELIRNIDELTPTWLSELFKTRVSDFSAESLGTGQMADAFRVSLRYETMSDDDADLFWDRRLYPESVVIKLAASDPASRSTGLGMRAYEIEVRFYSTLASRAQLPIPECYFADVDTDQGWFTLVLEDLAPAQVGDQVAGISLEAITDAVDSLAQLHSAFWGEDELEELEWLNRNTADRAVFVAGVVADLFDRFAERYRSVLSEHELQTCAQLMDRLESLMVQPRSLRTVVHGDFRPDNLLFSPSEPYELLGAVDWQTVAIGSPMDDVAYFIALGFADSTQRAQHERELVERYHGGLQRQLDLVPSIEQCWDEYRLGSFSTLVMTIGASMLVKQTQRGDEMFCEAIRHAVAQINDLDAFELLP